MQDPAIGRLQAVYCADYGRLVAAAAPETIPERMEFGYLPDGWTVTWDETANMLNDRVATLSWATPDCWYYVSLASTGYETVDRDTVLRILQGITP